MSGQITRGTRFGEEIYSLGIHPDYRTYLDIGTFHGTGTTKILVDALENNPICRVFSVEANALLYKSAYKYWILKPICLELLWGRLSDTMMSEEQIRSHPGFNDIKNHFDIYYKQDVIDFHNAPVVSLPDNIDVVISDGGEFCGMADMFRYLKHNPKVIALDDCNVMKNCDVKKHLLSNGWVVTAEGNDRNGWCILKRNDIVDDEKYSKEFDTYYTALGY